MLVEPEEGEGRNRTTDDRVPNFVLHLILCQTKPTRLLETDLNSHSRYYCYFVVADQPIFPMFSEFRDHIHVAAVNRAQECIGSASYNHAKVRFVGEVMLCFFHSVSMQTKDWVQEITDGVIADCRALSLEFKWIGTCIARSCNCFSRATASPSRRTVNVAIMQQNGAGMSSFTSSVGSEATDGSVTATFENASVVVCVSVYGCGFS